jgi:RNA-directed DNA polymerase
MRGGLCAISGNIRGLECPGRTATYLPSLDDAEPGHAQRRHDTHINDLRPRLKRDLATLGPLALAMNRNAIMAAKLARRGHRFCRYADDCNIYVRSHRAGERVRASISRFLTDKLRLKVNEAKSAVARPEERKFLGFSIANDGSERRIAPQALDKFKDRIREITCRTRGISLQQMIADLTPYLIGWRGYFGFCQTPRVLTNLEAWIRRRLRLYLWRQWRNGHNRFTELRRLGIAKFAASVAAGSPTGLWRMSGHPAVQHALRNQVFDSLGLPRIFMPVPA